MMASELKPGDHFSILGTVNDRIMILTTRLREAKITKGGYYYTCYDPKNFSIREVYGKQEVIKVDPEVTEDVSADIVKVETLKRGDRFKHINASGDLLGEWIVVDTSPQFQHEVIALESGFRTFCGKSVKVKVTRSNPTTFQKRTIGERFKIKAFGEWRQGFRGTYGFLFFCDSGEVIQSGPDVETKDI